MLRSAFLAFTCVFVFSGCWDGITRSVAATVLSQKGQILFAPAFSEKMRPITSGDRLVAGSIVRTSAESELSLMIVPGALARMSSNSEIKILQLQVTNDGNETGEAMRDRRARLELRHGAIVVLFDGFASFLIQVGDVSINVLPGCLLHAETDNEGIRVAVVRGKTYAGTAGNIVSIDAGGVREWKSGKPTPSIVEAGQIDAVEMIQAARELQELHAAHRDRLPF
jgi:hypothetical protein